VSAYRCSAEARDCQPGGDERRCGDDDLIAETDAQRREGEHESIEPIGDAHAVARADLVGEAPLEFTDLRSQYEPARVQDPIYRSRDRLLKFAVSRSEIDKRDVQGSAIVLSSPHGDAP
jgi:hypothetical protein